MCWSGVERPDHVDLLVFEVSPSLSHRLTNSSVTRSCSQQAVSKDLGVILKPSLLLRDVYTHFGEQVLRLIHGACNPQDVSDIHAN